MARKMGHPTLVVVPVRWTQLPDTTYKQGNVEATPHLTCGQSGICVRSRHTGSDLRGEHVGQGAVLLSRSVRS